MQISRHLGPVFWPFANILGFANKLELLVKTGIQFYPQVLRLPKPQPSTCFDTALSFSEDNGRKQLFPVPGRPLNFCLNSCPPPALTVIN